MRSKNFEAEKKAMEREILRMVYREQENPTHPYHREFPDFLLLAKIRQYYFRLEITEFYKSHRSSRLNLGRTSVQVWISSIPSCLISLCLLKNAVMLLTYSILGRSSINNRYAHFVNHCY